MIRVCFGDVSILNEEGVYRALYSQTSLARREKADRFVFRKDKNLCIGASALLNAGLREFGLSEAEMQYGAGMNGKPFFENAPEIHFNLSHSGDRVMAVFSDAEVGCDIEKVTEMPPGVAKRFFAPSEYEMLLSCPDQDARNNLFFRLWTLKESFLKASGSGLFRPMNSFEIRISEAGEASLGELNSGKQDPVFYEFDTIPGYRSAVCAERHAGSEEISVERICLGA